MIVCGLLFAATTVNAGDPPKAPVIIGIEHALSERMLAPQAPKSVWSIFQRTPTPTTVQSLDLGDGFSLVSDRNDLTGALLEVSVTAQQWSELTDVNYFLPQLKELTNRVYSKFNDDFDFVFFVLNAPMDDNTKSQLGFYGLNSRVSNNVTGLGVGKHDFTAEWGSQGKLISTIYLPSYDAISGGPALHEMLHSWGTFICPTFDVGNRQYLGHWGISNANGQAGGFKYLRVVEENSGGEEGKTLYQASRRPETNRDGSFKFGGFGINANDANSTPYSDIELYLMGLISDDELRNANFQLDVYSKNEYDPAAFADGYFYSMAKKTYTIDDLIARNGRRNPDASTSQKEFRVLTVVLTPETAEANYMSDIMRDINWLAGSVSDKTYPNLYNFRQATENRGSLIVNDLINSLITPVTWDIDENEAEEEPVIEDVIIADVTPEGGEDGNTIEAYVYPNPTDGIFTLEYEAQSESYVVTISDSRGVTVLRTVATDNLIQINLVGLPAGMYLLTIEDGTNILTERVIKK